MADAEVVEEVHAGGENAGDASGGGEGDDVSGGGAGGGEGACLNPDGLGDDGAEREEG